MNKNNLIQKMQRGGNITLQQYVPGQYIEEALGDLIEYDKFNKELQEEKRQFDKSAELQSDRNSIALQESQNRMKVARMEAERRKLDDNREDFYKFGAKLPPGQKAALANQLNLRDLADHSLQEKDRADRAIQEIDNYLADMNTNQDLNIDGVRNLMDKHAVALGEMSAWNPNYMNKITRDVEGYTAKESLISLKNTVGDEALKRLGIKNIDGWDKLNPRQARGVLAGLPTSIEMRRDLRDDDISNLQTMGKFLNEVLTDMGELGLQDTKRYENAEESLNKIIEQTRNLVSPDDDGGGGGGGGKRETQFVNVKTQKEGDNERLEAEKDYYVTFTDNKGRKRSQKMKGKKALQQIESYGNKIISAETPVNVADKGKPTINIGATVKDAKTGKILKYKGIGSILSPKLGGAELMEFEDSAGNIVRYRLKDIMGMGASKETFVSPSKKENEDFEVRYADKTPQEDTEEGWIDWAGEKIKGLTQTAAAAQQERRKKAEEREKKIQGKQKGGVIADTTQARLDEIDKILGEVPSEVTME